MFHLKSNRKKKIIVSVTNDLVTDNRVHKICTSLTNMGFDILLVGRKLKDSLPVKNRPYATKRMRQIFNKGPLFYAEYNKRLFLFLLFSKVDVLLSNDLDSLPANYLISKIKNKKLVFDSHEYFTEVPELTNRPIIQKIWKTIEKQIVPKLKYAYTVCNSIAELFFKEYGVKFEVVRNIPKAWKELQIPKELKLNTSKKIIIYQGAINIGRGLPQVISAMQFIENALLVIVGGGDICDELKKQVTDLHLEQKIVFVGRMPIEQVKYYTAQADLGLSIEEDIGLNYRFALPNKLFDYIQAHVPVMVSNLPEMANIVNQYQIGTIVDSHDPLYLADQIEIALNTEEAREKWKINLQKTAKELTWEKEEKVLQNIFRNL